MWDCSWKSRIWEQKFLLEIWDCDHHNVMWDCSWKSRIWDCFESLRFEICFETLGSGIGIWDSFTLNPGSQIAEHWFAVYNFLELFRHIFASLVCAKQLKISFPALWPKMELRNRKKVIPALKKTSGTVKNHILPNKVNFQWFFFVR